MTNKAFDKFLTKMADLMDEYGVEFEVQAKDSGGWAACDHALDIDIDPSGGFGSETRTVEDQFVTAERIRQLRVTG